MYMDPNKKTRKKTSVNLSVQDWFEEIHAGLEYRRQYGMEESWRMLEEIYENRHSSQANSGPNIVMATADSFMSALNVPAPYITVKARQPAAIESARLQETIDNELIDTMKLVREIGDRGCLSGFLFGKAILKIGYDSEFGYDPRYDYPKSPGMTLTQFNKDMNRIEFGPGESGMPWVQCVLPHDFVVPWGTFDIDSAPWVAHRVVRHVDDVRADAKYDSREVYPCMSMQDFVKSYERPSGMYRYGQSLASPLGLTRGSGDVQYCELWEIHDRRTGKILVLCTGCDYFLRNEIDQLQLEGGLPFVGMSFIPRTRNFWTPSDAWYLQQVQLELSDIAVQGQKHRRARVLKFLIDSELFSQDQLESLLDSDVGVASLIQNLGEKDLRNAVFPLQVQADIGLIQEAAQTYRNARQMIGLSPNQLGEYDTSSRRSATEASIVSEASTQRMSRRQAALAKTYVDVFKIVNPILWRFWNTPRLTQIMDQEGVQQWVSYTGQILKGDFSYSVGFTTGGNESLQQRRQNALQLWAMMSQNPFVDPTKLAQYLNLAFNDPEFSSIFRDGALNGQLQNQLQMMQMLQQQGAANAQTSTQGASGTNANNFLTGAV